MAAQVEEWHLEPDGIWLIVELVEAALRPSGETKVDVSEPSTALLLLSSRLLPADLCVVPVPLCQGVLGCTGSVPVPQGMLARR